MFLDSFESKRKLRSSQVKHEALPGPCRDGKSSEIKRDSLKLDGTDRNYRHTD